MPTLIRNLPPEIQEKAKNNTDSRIKIRSDLTLEAAFIWKDSPEGGKFWRDIASKYADMNEEIKYTDENK